MPHSAFGLAPFSLYLKAFVNKRVPSYILFLISLGLNKYYWYGDTIVNVGLVLNYIHTYIYMYLLKTNQSYYKQKSKDFLLLMKRKPLFLNVKFSVFLSSQIFSSPKSHLYISTHQYSVGYICFKGTIIFL